MTVFLIEMAYTKLLIKSELGLVSRIDFGIFFQPSDFCEKDTRLRFAYASAQHYARCPEEGNLRFTNSILTLALDNKPDHCTLKT